MAHVSVTINSRQYRMACDDGQESHLAGLANDLDARIARLRETFGEIGDMRLTVMAALILADELSEVHRRAHRLEQDLGALQKARAAAEDRSESVEAAFAAAFNSAAERIEKAARLIGQAGDGNQVAIG